MELITHQADIILASKSPRRKMLLENAGLKFRIIPSIVDEKSYTAMNPKEYVKILAESKAQDVADNYQDSYVIGADSIVLINNQILEKPDSTNLARRMIEQLNHSTHLVLTGYSIICSKASFLYSGVTTTKVTFKSLTQEEIEWYIHTTEPYDKAGGYAIQGLGSFMIQSINGSYSNVVGLPVCEVIDVLYKQGAISRKAVNNVKNLSSGN